MSGLAGCFKEAALPWLPSTLAARLSSRRSPLCGPVDIVSSVTLLIFQSALLCCLRTWAWGRLGAADTSEGAGERPDLWALSGGSNTVTSSWEEESRPHQKQNRTVTTPACAGASWERETGKPWRSSKKSQLKERPSQKCVFAIL